MIMAVGNRVMPMAPGAEPALLFLISAQIAAVVLRFSSKKQYAAWALITGTLPIFALIIADVIHYPYKVVEDTKFAAFEIAILALAAFSSGRYLRFCFWLAWLANTALIGVLVYLAFFWHVFS